MTSIGLLRTEPVGESAGKLEDADVVIIGGGFNGVMTAYWLAQKKVKVAILEKGEIAGEASSRAFGWISDLLLDPVKMGLSSQSKRLWKKLENEIGGLGYNRHGICFLAHDREKMDFFEGWRDSVKGLQTEGCAELLSQEQVQKRFPGLQTKVSGGILSHTDGSAEPRVAAVQIARAAQKLGVRIYTHCAARMLDMTGGRVTGVITERGRISASNVVFAGNAWSRLFCGNHGISVPQLYILTSMGRTGALPDGPAGAGGSYEWAWRVQPDGGYSVGRLIGRRLPVTRDSIQLLSRFIPAWKAQGKYVSVSFDGDAFRDWKRPRRWGPNEVSPFERERIMAPKVDADIGDVAFRELCEAFPAFKKTKMIEHWAGAVSIAPDNLPIASAVDQIPGFYLLTGCSYGMTWSSALGDMMSDLITGQKPVLDPSQFRFSRFFDGTRLCVAM